jgi:hypothetical protein
MNTLQLLLLADVEIEFEGWNTGGLLALLLAGVTVYILFVQMSAADRKRAKPRDPALSSSLVDESKGTAKSVLQNSFAAPAATLAAPVSKGFQRLHKRRKGNPVDLQLRDSLGRGEPIAGQVLDRSRGGLLITADRPAQVGDILKVRPAKAPENVEWIQIEVRHCRLQDGRHFFGCAFKEKLPWSTLLLFG